MSFGLRRVMAIFKWLFALSILGVVIAFFVLLFNDRSDFVNAVHAYGGSYYGIIAAAHHTGFHRGQRFQPRQHATGDATRVRIVWLCDRECLRGQRDPLAEVLRPPRDADFAWNLRWSQSRF